jgi:hypothetical protein
MIGKKACHTKAVFAQRVMGGNPLGFLARQTGLDWFATAGLQQ